MGEPGVSEGQGLNPPTEAGARKLGVDLPSFAESAGDLSSLVGQTKVDQKKSSDSPSFYERKDSDFPSFVEANSKFLEIASSPEIQKVMDEFRKVSENVDLQAGAVDVVEGYMKWVRITGDKSVAKLLTGNVANIVRRFSTDPNKVSETVAAWTEEEAQAFQKDLEDKGVITDKNKDSGGDSTPPPSSQASNT